MKKRNETTGEKAASAAGRLLAMMRNGDSFLALSSNGVKWKVVDITDDVESVTGSSLTQAKAKRK